MQVIQGYFHAVTSYQTSKTNYDRTLKEFEGHKEHLRFEQVRATY
jgi:hypothetical protein